MNYTDRIFPTNKGLRRIGCAVGFKAFLLEVKSKIKWAERVEWREVFVKRANGMK